MRDHRARSVVGRAGALGDYVIYDAAMRLRNSTAPDDIVIVAIDDRS